MNQWELMSVRTLMKKTRMLNESLHLVLFLVCSHFEETQHTYSMQVGTQRVWDYIGGFSWCVDVRVWL